MDLLKLVALDKDDIAVISTHLQDAVLKVGDIVWQPADKRLVLGINRFDWEAAQHGPADFRRRRTALRFDRVHSVKCRNIDRSKPDAVLNQDIFYVDVSLMRRIGKIRRPLLIEQVGVEPSRGTDWSVYDLMLSQLPRIVQSIRNTGVRAAAA